MPPRSSVTWARGGNVGGLYDLSKRTTLYTFVNYMKNQDNAGFRFSGSAAPSANLVGNDINGRSLTGLQAGILHRFKHRPRQVKSVAEAR